MKNEIKKDMNNIVRYRLIALVRPFMVEEKRSSCGALPS